MNDIGGAQPAYQAESGVFDEHVDESGQLRPLWSSMSNDFLGLGTGALGQRRRTAERLLDATGAAHTQYDREATEAGERLGVARIDPLPYVIDSPTWTDLCAGVVQRVSLHEAILNDVYGDSQLVREGVIPVEVVRGGKGFEQAAFGWIPTGRRLSRYAADIVRGADGKFVVVAEHTDAPTGLGRALLGRTILARVFPEAYDAKVESLVDFFGGFRSTISGLAPSVAEASRAVLLAPSILDPTYVEHAFLATQLGYNLVTTADLTVQGGRVWLRAIGGHEPVDVVVRGVLAQDSDALEISRRGYGVAGLVQAAREGTVGISNSIGSALSASAALLPFVDALCRRLLGEDLLLGSAPTQRCADALMAREIAADIDEFIVHEAFGYGQVQPPSGDSLVAALLRSPQRFVVQQIVPQGTAPVLAPDGQIVAGSVIFRLHAICDGHTTTVLPGGTAHSVAPGIEPMTKDIVVLASDRSSQRRPVAVAVPIDLRSSLSSRAAEALYWLGRNSERAEFVARSVRVVSSALNEDPTLSELSEGDWLRRACAFIQSVSGNHKPLDIDTDIDVAVRDALSTREGGLANSLRHIVDGASGVREFLSTTTWRVTAALERDRRELVAADAAVAGPAETIDHILVSLVALSGLAQDSMVRGPSWQFLDLGRRLERAHLLLSGFDAAFADAPDDTVIGPLGELVLASTESLVAYRRRYRTDVEFSSLVELLFHDQANPRSLGFQLQRVGDGLAALPERHGLSGCVALVKTVTGDLVANPAAGAALAALRRLHLTLGELDKTFTATWFSERLGQSPGRSTVS